MGFRQTGHALQNPDAFSQTLPFKKAGKNHEQASEDSMASNFNELTDTQRAVAENIANIGFQHGYSEKIINSALQLCNQESGLGQDTYNERSGASGIWQYLTTAHIQA